MKDHPSPHASHARRGPLKGGRSIVFQGPNEVPPANEANAMIQKTISNT